MSKIVDFVALGIAAIALLFCIVGLAIPQWLVDKSGSITVAYGLWSVCINSVCSSYSDENVGILDSLKAVRAMVLLGMIGVLAALVMAVVKTFVMKTNTMLSIVACILAELAGVVMLVGAIIFATKYLDDVNDLLGVDVFKAKYLNAGFALTIVAAVLSPVAGILFFVRRNAQE